MNIRNKALAFTLGLFALAATLTLSARVGHATEKASCCSTGAACCSSQSSCCGS
jgi:hypothetical protein